MNEPKETLAVQSYLTLMREVVIRIELIASACEGKLNLTPPYAREYSFLQFRRICELLALGCLQIHGELSTTQTKSAINEWNAEKIMTMLHREHPYAFPQSVVRKKSGNRNEINCNSNPNALTKEEFKKLYSECGQVLHRGTIRTLASSGTITAADYEGVMIWQKKLVDLLNEHILIKPGQQSYYLVSMKDESGFPICSKMTPKDSEIDVQTFKMTI